MPPILSFLRRIGILPRIRVLFFFHETTWSGAPIQLWHVVHALQARGYGVAAAVPKTGAAESGPISGSLAKMGAEIFPLVDLSRPPKMEELRALCGQFDVVVANTLVMWAAVEAANAEGIPVIWYIHESRVAEQLLAHNPGMQPALELADLLVMPTRRTAWLYAAFTDRAIEVVPYGIPPAPEQPKRPRETQTHFLLLGSYERRKGQDIFLEAIAQIPEEARLRGAFRMAGRALEMDFHADLASRAATLPNVELGSALEHDAALAATSAADVLVCASRDETMPIAILEAMSLGKAIVSTEVGGISEWLTDGKNALIVPAENSAALAQALTRCLNEPGFVANLGAESRRTFTESFSIHQLGTNFARLIEQVRTKR
ncbi:MAG: glycosyltransferase family 4 protein [Chthoniobacterales bacterium]|nr:glycosyltransferase family 4 protein [Chthoniobacterales bacterium]